MNRTPKLKKTFEFTEQEDQALKRLVRHGYAFPADSGIGAIKKMLRAAWEQEFPGEKFPGEEAEID